MLRCALSPSQDSFGQRFAGEHVMPIETGNDENEASSAEAEEAALFGSWQIDQRTGRFSWSDEVFRIFGVDPQTFTPSYEAVLARAHPEDRARLGKAYADAVAALAGEKSDDVLSIEHRILLDDGSIKFVHERGRMIYDEKGHAVRSIGIVLDVTGQKKLENELRDAKAAFVEAQSVAQVGSWQWNIQNGHVAWSDECFRILGLDPASFAPSFDAYLARVHPDDRDTLVSSHKRSLEDRIPCTLDQRIIRDDGTLRFVQQRWKNFYSSDGKPLRSSGSIQDITERKNAENALRHRTRSFRRDD